LQNLNLYHNGVGEKGAIALADALKTNTGLQNLNLHRNGVGEKGTITLADAQINEQPITDISTPPHKIHPKHNIDHLSFIMDRGTFHSRPPPRDSSTPAISIILAARSIIDYATFIRMLS
ncbi:hypothetical protein BC938DRAFT_482550, partial [Jimgerdemannia flammicorona]